MQLTLRRTKLTEQSTEGELGIDGEQQCVTLELPVKDGLPGSAIPPGLYVVVLLPSPKFEKSTDPWVMKYAGAIPHLLGIPNRTDILVHWGNSPHDTNGCILVGTNQEQDFIGGSRAAFEKLWLLLRAAKDRGEVISIAIDGGIPLMPADLSLQGDV